MISMVETFLLLVGYVSSPPVYPISCSIYEGFHQPRLYVRLSIHEPSKDLDEQIQNSIHLHPGEKAARDCWVQSQEEACTMQTIQDTQVLLNVMPKRISQRSNVVHDSLGTCVDMGSSGRMHA